MSSPMQLTGNDIYEKVYSGSSTDNYVVCLSVPARFAKHLSVNFKNMDNTNSLLLKITSKNVEGGDIETTELDETQVAPTAYIKYIEDNLYSSIFFYVKSMDTGQVADYTIEVVGYRRK